MQFIVYGAIECDPVAILDTREALELQATLKSGLNLGYASGRLIGQVR
jgi:hypothetical protein